MERCFHSYLSLFFGETGGVSNKLWWSGWPSLLAENRTKYWPKCSRKQPISICRIKLCQKRMGNLCTHFFSLNFASENFYRYILLYKFWGEFDWPGKKSSDHEISHSCSNDWNEKWKIDFFDLKMVGIVQNFRINWKWAAISNLF